MSSCHDLSVMRLFRSFQTSVELCLDRGYTIKEPRRLVDLLFSSQRQTNNTHENGRDQAAEDGTCTRGSSINAEPVTYDWFHQYCVRETSKSGEKSRKDEFSDPRHYLLTLVCWKEIHEDNAMDTGEDGSEKVKTKASVFRENLEDSVRELLNTERSQSLSECQSKDARPSDRTGDDFSVVKRRDILAVVFSSAPSLSMKEVVEKKHYVLSHFKANRLIIVAPKVTNQVRRDARESLGTARLGHTIPSPLSSPNLVSLELFEEQELVFNPSHHETVPRHVVLSPGEVRELLWKHQVALTQLPRMSESDPMARYVGAVRGDVVRLDRQSKDSGPYVMYRQVM